MAWVHTDEQGVQGAEMEEMVSVLEDWFVLGFRKGCSRYEYIYMLAKGCVKLYILGIIIVCLDIEVGWERKVVP